MIQNNLDGAIRSFRAWCEGKEGFDELELKEAIQQHVEYVIGAKYTDLTSKYEEYDGKDGIRTELFDDESEENTGEKLALLANFVADKTANEIYGEQLKRAELREKVGK